MISALQVTMLANAYKTNEALISQIFLAAVDCNDTDTMQYIVDNYADRVENGDWLKQYMLEYINLTA